MGKESSSGMVGKKIRGLVLSDVVPLPALFSQPENVRQLIARGRTPVNVGAFSSLPRVSTGGTAHWDKRFVYTIPPAGLTDSDIQGVDVDCGGSPQITDRNGKNFRSPQYLVTEAQSKVIEGIIAESQRNMGENITK